MHERKKKKGWLLPLLALFAITVMIISSIGIWTFVMLSRVEPEVGAIGLIIEGREATIKAEVEMDDSIDIRSSDLILKGAKGSHPLTFEDHEVVTTMGAYDLAGIIEAGGATMEGVVDVRIKPLPFTLEADLKKEIDLSMLQDLNASAEIHNVSLGLGPIGQIRVLIDFKVDLDKEIWIRARNTTATIRTHFGSFTGSVILLDLDLEGSGKATVGMPYLAVLPLTLGNDDITVDFWGIPIDFEYPVNG